MLAGVKNGSITVKQAVDRIKKLNVFNKLEVCSWLTPECLHSSSSFSNGYDVRDIFEYAAFEKREIDLQ